MSSGEGGFRKNSAVSSGGALCRRPTCQSGGSLRIVLTLAGTHRGGTRRVVFKSLVSNAAYGAGAIAIKPLEQMRDLAAGAADSPSAKARSNRAALRERPVPPGCCASIHGPCAMCRAMVRRIENHLLPVITLFTDSCRITGKTEVQPCGATAPMESIRCDQHLNMFCAAIPLVALRESTTSFALATISR